MEAGLQAFILLCLVSGFIGFAADLLPVLQRDRVFGFVPLLPHTKAGVAMRHCRCVAKGASGRGFRIS